jgi:hypothetical protein
MMALLDRACNNKISYMSRKNIITYKKGAGRWNWSGIVLQIFLMSSKEGLLSSPHLQLIM